MKKNDEKSRKLIVLGLIIFFLPAFMWAQNISITGIVSDSSGEPVPGVSIVLEGTTIGTISNTDGAYSLEVPETGRLLFSFIGFKNQAIPIDGKNVVNVVLIEDTENLEEIVVVGYGTQRKEAVTGSVSSVRGDIVREMPSANVSQALQGRVAGVQLAQTSTKPGADMQIRIRGVRSLNASNDPLVVLDGIPFAGSIGDISPSNIKSMDILKDASATAIYGSRGANGVIMITTNKGTKGQEAQISYNGYYGVKTVFGEYPMMNGADFAKLREAAGIYDNTLDESDDVNTDWQDLLYANGMVTSHDVGINGGTEKSSYSFGVGYYKEEAVLPGQDYNRISIRGSIDQEIGEFIKVGMTTNSNHAINNGSNLGVYGTLNSSPLVNPYNQDGSIKRVFSMPLDDQWTYTRKTVNALGDSWIDQTKATSSYNSIFAEVKIPGVEGLKYRMNVGLNYRQSNSGDYNGKGVFQVNEDTKSSASVSHSNTTSWAVENVISYDKHFGSHSLNVVGLYSAEEELYSKSHVSATDIPSDAFQFYNLGRANDQPIVDPSKQGYYKSGLKSYMARVMYGYDNRYMVSLSYRTDGSSRLAEGHKWVSYPAVSVGWNMANESFMDQLDIVNSLKLRVGYGVASNQSVDPYSTLGLLDSRPYNFGSDFRTGLYVNELPNPELGWEYTSTMNYGVDFTMLNARLSGTIEYYVAKTSDLLFRVGLPQTSGSDNYMANIGESENKGFELSLDGVILDNYNGWTWSVGVNLYANRNKLTKLASGQTEDRDNWWFVGKPIDVIYDYEAVGLWNTTDPDYQYLEQYEPGGNEGMIKVKYTGEYNSDGSPVRAIGPEDRQVMSMEPDFMGGFNTNVSYKGFDLSMVGAFQKGGLLIATPYGSRGYLNILTGRRGNIDVDYWTEDNKNATFPKPGGIGGDSPRYLNSLSYFDASYLKVRTITLGYTFQQDFIKKIGINKLRLYATAQNPFVLFSPFNDESGMDPETNSYANENAAVAFDDKQKRLLTIGTNTPTTRNYLFGINVTF
ncbi:SusC/RagA family TonB-linked outer membrane protein [Saccharicrinis fermentans]|uniref:Outer membrane cobalamin receptor protein n=1 Tax=Saccharicrinis fermentans DSM 9555 = JCM 21142 TaxID=869213 RepID=W7YR20_9BACT|nr:TonB-dependent receptor [Saccharicrinis fermentans]GAF04874.1 outer membrane cobalamin receptor protein [Saccharicrinis fermentans DSM 9555 = JCM 21142]